MDWPAQLDPFQALGVPRDAPAAAVRARYRELARRYHPNRHQVDEELETTTSDHFYLIHQAWKLLSKTNSRRRYVELLQLIDEQDAITTSLADLLDQAYQNGSQQHPQSPSHDGHISSDADEDPPPNLGLRGHRATMERMTSSSKHLSEATENVHPDVGGRVGLPHKRSKAHDPALPTSTDDAETKDPDYFTVRRKRLDKLRRKEGQAFFRYRDAMVEKFEAELRAERAKEHYEMAKWRREYCERAPRETADRMRSFQHFIGAVRAFGLSRPRRRNQPALSNGEQILSTDQVSETSQYLTPDSVASPSRRRSMHRRGWSSDISGDQTSSEDNSSGGRVSPKLPPSWVWHRQHTRHSSLDAFQNITRQTAPLDHDLSQQNGFNSLPTTEHQPFRLTVRQPTGIVPHAIAYDSSGGSVSAASRSPSPHTQTQFPQDFVIVRPSRIDWLKNGDPLGGSSTSTAKESGCATDKEANNAVQQHIKDVCSFEIKHLGSPERDRVPLVNVHLLNYAEKSRMLAVEGDAEAAPTELMLRLSRLDHNVARKFIVKPDIKSRFNFRLVYGHKDVVKDQTESFIAISYRRRIHVERKNGAYSLPLEPAMYQAVWNERNSDTEGVWIDQICIGDTERERTISMSAMDMVYRSARLAVVVLDDVELSAHEGTMLESHMAEYAAMSYVAPTKRFRRKQPPYLDKNVDLYHLLQKLLSSSWFRRAWCRHEMRLARDHVFLVPCKSPGTWTGKSVMRFTGRCLTHLLALATEVPFENHIEMVKPALHAFFRDRSKLAPHEPLVSHHGNFTTVIAEVFAMEAGGDPRIPAQQRAADAMKDKISIILNTMECGLALSPETRDPKMSLSKSECHYMLLMLAIAAQDPGALCTVGPPMRLLQAEALSPTASSTWLFEPTNVDSGLNNYRTLNRLPADSSVMTRVEHGEHYVQLDLKFVTSGKVLRPVESEETFALARHIVDVCSRRGFGRNRTRYLISDHGAQRHFGDMKEVYIQTLTCVIECGPDWMEEVCHRYGVSRWKQDLQCAYELLIALKNTGGKWPETAWSPQAAGFIMDFVNFIVIRGLPQRQIVRLEEWRPIWVKTVSGGKVITFVPPGNIRPAVPTALLDPDYVHLARLWVLTRRPSFFHHDEQAQHPDDWTLVGKSVLFSDDLSIQHMHSQGGIWRKQQKVFGREDPDIHRELRERSLHL